MDAVQTELAAIGAESGNDDILDAADLVDAAIDNIGVWVAKRERGTGEDEIVDDGGNHLDDTVIEIDDEDLPF